MLLIKTKREYLRAVVENAKHALMQRPHAEAGDIILIAQTRDELEPDEKPIKYRMELRRIDEDMKHESESIFRRHWTYIVVGCSCLPLKSPFDISEVQVTKKCYRQGGTFFYVDPTDVRAITEGRYLDVMNT